MSEIKTSDLQEVKKPVVENYHNIKPETSMSVQDARNTWDNAINNEIGDNKNRSLEENKEDRNKVNSQEDIKPENAIEKKQEVKSKLKNPVETIRTKEEISLLKLLASGELDGQVGDYFYTGGGSTVWTEIKDGIPVRYKQGPGGKYFDGKENVRYEGTIHIKEKWKTDDEKLAFLQKYGWLIENDDVKNYSKKFKPEY